MGHIHLWQSGLKDFLNPPLGVMGKCGIAPAISIGDNFGVPSAFFMHVLLLWLIFESFGVAFGSLARGAVVAAPSTFINREALTSSGVLT